MSILEMILTLLIPWGAVLWGVNIYHQKRHLVSGRMEYNERRRKSLL